MLLVRWNSMKKQCIVRIAIFIVLLSQTMVISETTIINKIKVIGNSITSTHVITGFVREFKEGDTVELKQLESITAAIKRRLLMTTWFYSVDVYIVKREQNETTSNVIIEVQEGYLLHFGGGNAYGSFGKENISGQGIFAGIDAGYNKQEVSILRPYSPYYYLLSAGNTPYTYVGPDLMEKAIQSVGWGGEIGKNLPYDMAIGLHCDADKLFSDTYHEVDGFVRESFVVRRDTRDDIFSPNSGSYVACSVGYLSGPELSTASLDARLYYSLLKNTIKWAGQGKFEGVQGDVRDNFFYPSLFGIDGIRAPVTTGMYGNSAFQIVNELRGLIFKETVLGFFLIAAEPALFFSAGCAGNSAHYFKNNKNYLYSFGIAARLFFYAPIFVPVRLEWGWNESGAKAVFFSVSKPF
jgi:outer membrane protein assembly factor BamA